MLLCFPDRILFPGLKDNVSMAVTILGKQSLNLKKVEILDNYWSLARWLKTKKCKYDDCTYKLLVYLVLPWRRL